MSMYLYVTNNAQCLLHSKAFYVYHNANMYAACTKKVLCACVARPYVGPPGAFNRVREKIDVCGDSGHMQAEERKEVLMQLMQLMVETEDVPLADLTEVSSETLTANKVLSDLLRKREATVHSDEFRSAFPECAKAEQIAEQVSSIDTHCEFWWCLTATIQCSRRGRDP